MNPYKFPAPRHLSLAFLGALGLAATLAVSGCSTTEKSSGVGLVSAVAQNVIRVAAWSAIGSADFSRLKGQKVSIRYTGFQDERSRGFIDSVIRDRLEALPVASLSESAGPELALEVVVNAAGNDRGGSWAVISTSERTEGVIDLTFNIRDAKSGNRISSQNVKGEAKYEQSKYVGLFTPDGSYYVKKRGIFEKIPGISDPDCKRDVFSQVLFSGCK